MYRYGMELCKDFYGRPIKVGHMIDTLTYFGGEVCLWRVMAIGITDSGNLRTLQIYKNGNTNNKLKAHVTWEPKYKAFEANAGKLQSVTKPSKWRPEDYFDWVNNYMMQGQPESSFVALMESQFNEKELQKMRIEL